MHELPFGRILPFLYEDGTVLLESSRCDELNYRSLCFHHPVATHHCTAPEEIPRLLESLQQSVENGFYVAGFLSYEAAYAFEQIATRKDAHRLLAWFGIYEHPLLFDHRTGLFSPEPAQSPESQRDGHPHGIRWLRLGISEGDYTADLDRVKHYLREGETYQINYTTHYAFETSGDAAALYGMLRGKQPVPFAAFVRTGTTTVLSFSPELFFRVRGKHITAQPMKGTAPRGRTTEEDRLIAEALAGDGKSRAENLMIVDLLRNDLGRICAPGSVVTTRLFEVERYATLQQMTSTITGSLEEEARIPEIVRSLFPCGSVTGAPKIRSMQIIHELERAPRGVYTGAIGYVAPGGEACFNVAIRTLEIRDGAGTMGVGGGIVIESDTGKEFAECLLKAEFLTKEEPQFSLLETILWADGYPFIGLHLDRLLDSAGYFAIPLDRTSIEHLLDALARDFPAGSSRRVRITVDRTGTIRHSSSILSVEQHAGPARACISRTRTNSSDKFLYHKTTHRPLYDAEYASAVKRDMFDVLFFNERGEVTEGAISNIIAEQDGRWYTPPLSSGLLDGVYRRHLLIQRADIIEKVLFPDDLRSSDKLFCCNAVRGLREIILVGDLDGMPK